MSKTSSSQGFPDLPPRSLLTVVEAADFFRVSKQTIYFWIDQGTLGARRFGGSIRVPTSEVIRIFNCTTEE